MKIVVFTDLDGTLLDAQTYSYDAASEALEALMARDAALVLVSSKTFVEMEHLHRALGFAEPFVVENGGGIALSPTWPIGLKLMELRRHGKSGRRSDFLLLPLGASYEMLVKELHEISAETGLGLRGFSTMRIDEVAAFTGLTREQAERARQRDFDEPFVLLDGADESAALIARAAQRRGLSVLLGGRFWHLVGHEGKGQAVSLLVDAYRRLYGGILTVGLGDSPNDYSFLGLMDVPVLVGRSGPGDVVSGLEDRCRHVPQAGPVGWNLAILQILSDLKEPI